MKYSSQDGGQGRLESPAGNKGVNFEGLSPEEAPLPSRVEELRKTERDRPHHGN